MESRIIHAKATGGMDTTTCGAIGNECTLTRALTVVTATKNIIKLDDDAVYTAEGGFVVEIQIPLTIAARGATLDRGDGGPILTVSEDQNVTILGGTITGATGSNGDGIVCGPRSSLALHGTTIASNEESAIETDQCALNLSRATINNNSTKAGGRFPAIEVRNAGLTMWLSKVSSNPGGGVRVINGNIIVVGNLFHDNGETGTNPSSVGGLFVETTTDPMNRIEFNTIVDNDKSDVGAGIYCLPGAFTAKNNIIWDTRSSTAALIGSVCRHSYSDIRQSLVTTIDAGNNINQDPLFESDFSPRSGSPVRQKADPNANLSDIASKDLAGREREAPADIGAYQVPRP